MPAYVTSITLHDGKTVTVTEVPLDQQGNPGQQTSPTFVSSDPTIATVGNIQGDSFDVIGVAPGTCNINCQAQNGSGSFGSLLGVTVLGGPAVTMSFLAGPEH